MQTRTTHSLWLCSNTSCQSNRYQQLNIKRNSTDPLQQTIHLTLILNIEQNLYLVICNQGKAIICLRLYKSAPTIISRNKLRKWNCTPCNSKKNMFMVTEWKMIKETDTLLSYSHHSSSDWTPIGHEATLSSHTTSQPPLTMATTSHDYLPWPATTDKPGHP